MSPPAIEGGSEASPSLPSGTERTAVGRALRAIMVKELRQNLAFLVLAMLLEFILLVIVEWFRSGFLFTSMGDVENILLVDSVRSSITLGCMFTGFVLGILQPLSDRNFDLWAFLIHRPVSRTVLFCGRASAGMILYFIATGLPLLAVVIWGMTPSGGKVFLWTYVLPPIVDYLTGIACYFAGLLVTERRALLYGSKTVPLVLGVCVTILGIVLPFFWEAVLVTAAFVGVLATAAAASTASHGYTLRVPRVGRWAILIVISLGFSILGAMPAAVGIGDLSRVRSQLLNFGPDQRPYLSKQHLLMNDGSVALQETQFVWDSGRGSYMPMGMQYYDLNGKPLQLNVHGRWLFPAELHISFDSWNNYPGVPRSYRDLQHDAEAGATVERYDYQWWAVDAKKIFYIYRRHVVSPNQEPQPWEFFGTFGSNGLVKGGTSATPFDTPQLHFDFILTPTALYGIDMIGFRLAALFKAEPGETLLQWQRDFYMQDGRESVLVLTTRRMAKVEEGEVLAQIPVHDVQDNRLQFTRLYLPPENTPAWAVSYVPWHEIYSPNHPQIWEIYDAHEKLLSTVTVPHVERPGVYRPAPTPTEVERRVRLIGIEQGVWFGAANPVLLLASALLYQASIGMYHSPGLAFVGFWLIEEPLALWGMLAVLSLSAVATWLLATRYRLRFGWVWVLAAFLCGPAIVLTLVAVNRLPRRRECPKCGKRRPLGLARCPVCGEGWQEPKRNGTEIFA